MTGPRPELVEAGPPLYLLEKSALARAERNPLVQEAFLALDEEGVLATCDVIDLEVGYSARTVAEYERIWDARASVYRTLPVTAEVTRRARVVQRLLAERSEHRGAGVADLLIAACAELNRATVVHYDADYETIAQTTKQPIRWIVPRGTVP